MSHFPAEAYRSVAGTLVFIDISGFTRLSERLAMKGREGAEEVADFLNLSFGAMLGIAEAEGGDLLKYGGDALLLLFTGPGHAGRACRTTHAARRGLREARVGVSAGVPPLRMSVGVHSGTFDCFLVGQSHRELIITGGAASLTAEMEGIATAGEILVSPATAGLLARRVLGKAKGAGILLARAPDTSVPPAESGALAGPSDLEMAVPVALRPHLASASAAGEHRLATIAFVKYTGMDALLASGGPPAAAVALEKLITACQEAAEEYDVSFLSTDIDKDGGKVILTAGAPNAGEDETGRLLLAARRVVATDCGLAVRVGVNRGYVFAGDVGGANRRAYTVIGDAVNLAARVMGKAEPGQVLATRETLASTPMAFAVTPLAPFMVKGKSALVEAVVVGEPGETSSITRPRHPLIGRDTELAALVAALDSARNGAGSAVEVCGEGGIGKTRLIEELLSKAGDISVHEARTGPYATHSAYFPFRRLLRAIIGLAAGDGADQLLESVERRAPALRPWLPLLASAMDIPVPATAEVEALDPQFRIARLHRTVQGVLEAFVDRPALFVFEDSGWHDQATRELLRSLVLVSGEHPWLLVISTQEPDASLLRMPACVSIQVGPLAREAAMTLAAQVLPDGAERRTVQAAVERAGGNPLFLLELVAAAASGRSLDALPSSVEALVAARIDELPPAGRQLVRFAAVIGAVFDPSVVRAAFEEEGTHVLDPLAFERLGGFIERDEGTAFRFRHRLYREAAYEGLPFRTRRRLHARLVDLYERTANGSIEDVSELIAVHAGRANDHERSWRYGVMAAERARGQFANMTAAAFFQQAIRAARALPGIDPLELARVAEARGDVLELAGQYDEATTSLLEAGPFAAGHLLSTVRLLRKRGTLRERTGEYRKALGSLARARTLVASAPRSRDTDVERLQVLVGLGAVRFRQGRYAEAARLCSEALGPDAPAGDDDREAKSALAHAYYLLGHARSFLQEVNTEDLRERALELYDELGDFVGQANALNNLGIGAYYAGNLERAIQLWERSRDACARAGDVMGEARQQNNIGEVLSDRGDLEGARALFTAAGDAFHSAGYRIGEALTLSNLGRVATRDGRASDAEPLLRAALIIFREIGSASFAAEAEVRIVENLVASQRWLDGARLAGEVLARSTREPAVARQESTLLRLRGVCVAAMDDRGAARADFERAVVTARKRSSPPDEQAAAELLASLSAG